MLTKSLHYLCTCFAPLPKFQPLNRRPIFMKMRCAHYATTDYPNIVCFNFLQLFITQAQTCEIESTTGPEIQHGNRSLQYIPLPPSKFFVKCKTRKLWLHEHCLAFGFMITLQLQFQVLLMMGAMYTRIMQSNFAVNKYLHTVASCWILLIYRV